MKRPKSRVSEDVAFFPTPEELLAQLEKINQNRASMLADLKTSLYVDRYDPTSSKGRINKRAEHIKKLIDQEERLVDMSDTVTGMIKKHLKKK